MVSHIAVVKQYEVVCHRTASIRTTFDLPAHSAAHFSMHGCVLAGFYPGLPSSQDIQPGGGVGLPRTKAATCIESRERAHRHTFEMGFQGSMGAGIHIIVAVYHHPATVSVFCTAELSKFTIRR